MYAETRQKIADAYHASAAWVAEHKTLLIEIAAVGAVACMAGSMALINLAKDAAQGNVHDWGDAFASLGTGALQGLAAGAGGVVGGRIAAFAAGKLGGLAATLGGRVLVGALSGGAEDVTTQSLSTGRVDWSGVAMSATAGAVLGGRAPAGGRGGAVSRAVDGADVTPSPRRNLSADSGAQSPGRGDPDGARSGRCPDQDTHSFDPGTRVVMADGSTKPIKDVQVGDSVRATDPETGAEGARTVTVLHGNRDTDLTDVTVRDAAGAVSVLATTQRHPFWDATAERWADAKDLQPGHTLRTPDGGTVTVTRVVTRDITATGGTQMRDLTIADLHTYYVIAGTVPVLVHNCGGDVALGTRAHGVREFADQNGYIEYTKPAFGGLDEFPDLCGVVIRSAIYIR